MSKTVLYVDDYDTSRLGLLVREYEALDPADRQDVTAAIPQIAGLVLLDAAPRVGVRTITVSGIVKRSTVKQCRDAVLELWGRLARGTVQVRFADLPDLVYFARLPSGKAPPRGPQVIEPTTSVLIQLRCLVPYAIARDATLVAFGTVKGACPLGTARVWPLLRLGAATNPTITYRRADGTIAGTLGLTVTIGANDYLEVDCEGKTVTRYQAGVATDGINLISSGNFIVLDPDDGDATTALWPTLELSAGSGDARYRRVWV